MYCNLQHIEHSVHFYCQMLSEYIYHASEGGHQTREAAEKCDNMFTIDAF